MNRFDLGPLVDLSEFLKPVEPGLAGGQKPEFLKTDEPHYLKTDEPGLAERQRAYLRAWRARRRSADWVDGRTRAGRAARGRAKTKRPPWRVAHAVAAAMVPGCWYGSPDIARLCGRPARPLQVILRRMEREGELERVQDPAWRPIVYSKGKGIERQVDGRCRWLWRLTPRGVELRGVGVLMD